MGSVFKAIASIFGGGSTSTSISLPTIDANEATPSVRKETQASTVLGSDSVAAYLKKKKTAGTGVNTSSFLGGLGTSTNNLL